MGASCGGLPEFSFDIRQIAIRLGCAIWAACVIGALATPPAGANTEPDKSASASQPAAKYLEPALKTGQAYTDLFARVQTLQIEGLDEKKGYNGGMGTYVVSADSTAKNLKFSLSYQYHGAPPDSGPAEIRDGGRPLCFKGQCEASRDASGLVYNPSVWGVPRRR